MAGGQMLNNTRNIIVGMSGGVDSSVAAARLIDEGYESLGLTMNLFACHRPKDRGCCSTRDRMDAHAVCKMLDMSLHVLDARDRFKSDVIEPFIDDYFEGRTPSPCIP